MSTGYSVRTMSRDEMDQAIEWAAGEGWNPGHADADCFAVVDPQGFYGGWLGDRMIASISVVNYGATFSFLGFYIVDEPYRGQGYGYRLWQEALGHAGDRLVGLDGVLAEQDNYRRSGFELAYRNIRYGGIPDCAAGDGASQDMTIVPVRELTSDIIELDRRLFPVSREAFLRAWLSAPGHVARTAHDGADLTGFGTIRPCRNGRKIGPLFARDRATAEGLIAVLVSDSADSSGSGEVFLDVPEPNTPAVGLAEGLGLRPVFETARMYTGQAPDVDVDQMFGVTTFELG